MYKETFNYNLMKNILNADQTERVWKELKGVPGMAEVLEKQKV